jgi:hypothetical protein
MNLNVFTAVRDAVVALVWRVLKEPVKDAAKAAVKEGMAEAFRELQGEMLDKAERALIASGAHPLFLPPASSNGKTEKVTAKK